MTIKKIMDAIYRDLPLDAIPWNIEEPPGVLVDLVERYAVGGTKKRVRLIVVVRVCPIPYILVTDSVTHTNNVAHKVPLVKGLWDYFC